MSPNKNQDDPKTPKTPETPPEETTATQAEIPAETPAPETPPEAEAPKVSMDSSGIVSTEKRGPKPKPAPPKEYHHLKDNNFLEVAKICVPKKPLFWRHPKNENIVFAYNLNGNLATKPPEDPDALKESKHLDIEKASREDVLEWVYINLWRKLGFYKLNENKHHEAAFLLQMFMLMRRQKTTLMIQKAISNSTNNLRIDGAFGHQTIGTAIKALKNNYDLAARSLLGEQYNVMQSQGIGDPDVWGPILEAYKDGKLQK